MDFDSKAQGTPIVQHPLHQQLDKNTFMSRDSYQNTNYSQVSDNYEENSPALGQVKSESVLNELEQNRTMDKGNNKKFQIPKKWEWLPCNYELKREEKDSETYWSLAPIIQLVNSDSKTIPETDISIQLERPFMYNPEVGWNWHKSWNLPNLTINIKITDPKTKTPVLPPADLKAQLLAVKVLLNKVEQVKLYDLGLKGGNPQDLSDGVCTFSGVKFSSTSYNNDGVKFHLIVLVYIQEDTRNRTCPKIMYSRISPPIFVDSRKAARNSHIYKNKKINSIYFDSFPPDTFMRNFIKRNNKLDGKEEMIENSLDGLSHYFTAPNIRNKVKHPIFLAYRFSKCAKLYYNEQLVKKHAEKDELNSEDLLYTMQKLFLENHRNKKDRAEFPTNSNKAFDNKSFILMIEEPENPDAFILNKKIADYLDPVINDVLHVIFNSNLLPAHFTQFPMDNIAMAYTAVYPRLQELKDSYGLILDDDNEDYEYSKNTPTSNQRSDISLKEEFGVKREGSGGSSDLDEDGDSEEDEDVDDDQSGHPSVSAPRKKVKGDTMKVKTENIDSIGETSSATNSTNLRGSRRKAAQPKEKITNEKKSRQTRGSKAMETKIEVKTETDDLLLKSEDNSSTTMFEKPVSIKTHQEKLSKGKPKAKKGEQKSAATGVNTSQNKINGPGIKNYGDSVQNHQANVDFMMNMQQQQKQDMNKNQFLMMMYQQNFGKTPQEGFIEMQNGIQQQNQVQKQDLGQQQLIEAQMMKQQQHHQQLWQLQQRLRLMHDKGGANTDKDKLPQGENNVNIANHFAMAKGLTPQMFNGIFAKTPQYPGIMAGFPGGPMGNRGFNPAVAENYGYNIYNGLQIGQQEDGQTRALSSFVNAQQDPHVRKNMNLQNNKGMYNFHQSG